MDGAGTTKLDISVVSNVDVLVDCSSSHMRYDTLRNLNYSIEKKEFLKFPHYLPRDFFVIFRYEVSFKIRAEVAARTNYFFLHH